uniref:MATH domain-containing protein n=2 Tax=Acrobeloides nanus TaxID=290746 RepID=A0A914BUS6_9BILA
MSILGKTEFRIRWTPDSAEYWPSVHFVAGHSWSVCMKYHSDEQTGHMPFLSIYIYCNKDRTMPSEDSSSYIASNPTISFSPSSISQSTSEEESIENKILTENIKPYVRFPSTSSDKENEINFGLNGILNSPIRTDVDELRERVKFLEEERKKFINEMELYKKLNTGVITDLEEKNQEMLEKNINLVVDNQDLKGKILSLEKVVKEKNSEIANLYSQINVLKCSINVLRSQNQASKLNSIQLVVTHQKRQTVAERLFNM